MLRKEILEKYKQETPAGRRYKPRPWTQLASKDIEDIVKAYKTNGQT